MSLAEDVAAIRTSVALSDGGHLACVRVTGAGAHELLDRVSPRELFVRAGQMLHTLLLDEAGTPRADVYLCCDEDDYLVVAEGLTGPALADYLRAFAGGLDTTIIDLSETHGFLCLDGPFAWELLAEITSPDIIGLPYLGFFHEGRFTCFRGGKTGEYGYDLMIEHDRLAGIRDRLLDAGGKLELRAVGLPALESCVLEGGFFNVRREVRAGLTPIELQLQWRVRAGRTFPGSTVLEERRTQAHRRATMIASDAELASDAAIELDGTSVGSVLHAQRSYTRGEWLGLALLDRAVAHAGLAGFSAGTASIRTISAPAVNNRSLYVNPQRHSWATRGEHRFPPLVRPSWS